MSVYSGNSGIFNVLIWILISYVQCLLTGANYLDEMNLNYFLHLFPGSCWLNYQWQVELYIVPYLIYTGASLYFVKR